MPRKALHSDARPLTPDEQEAHDGLLLALLARKRVLVLAGDDPQARGRVLSRFLERAAADGAMTLAVEAAPGLDVEDLVVRAAAASGHRAKDGLDPLLEALERRLDMAGTGLLAVAEAQRLDPGALFELTELARSPTPGGRFLQVLVSGDGALESALARPDLAAAVRDLGVVHRIVAAGAAPARPGAARRVRPFAVAATALLLLAAGAAGALVWLPEETTRPILAAAGAQAERAARGARALYAHVSDRVGMWAADADPEVALAPGPDAASPAGPGLVLPVAPPAPAEPPKRTPPMAAPDPDPNPDPGTLAGPVHVEPPRQNPPSFPDAPEPAPANAEPGPAEPDPAQESARQELIDALMEEAARRIADRRLTTPAGISALDTLRRIRAIDPDAPEAARLIAEITDIYRGWADRAAAQGRTDMARVFLRRALTVAPDDMDLKARLDALGGAVGAASLPGGPAGGEAHA